LIRNTIVVRFGPLAVLAALLAWTVPVTAEPVLAFSSPVSSVQAVSQAVRAANLTKLATTYSLDKAKRTLAKAGIRGPFSLTDAQDLAAAVDSGLLAPGLIGQIGAEKASSALTQGLITAVAQFTGQGHRSLGRVSDRDISLRISDAFSQSDLISAPELRKVVEAVLKQKVITGYNLKDSRYDPRFNPASTLTYGHSDLLHAIQLIGLLRSEGLDAEVQLEPKTSAFLYLKEWGPTGPSTRDVQFVPLEDGNAIEYAKEYDLSFEFATPAERDRFQPVILTYAKKNSKDQPGLIAGSWWQPLYYAVVPVAGYEPIINNKIPSDPYYAQSFSLTKDSPAVVEAFRKAGAAEVATSGLWVDHPFVNYLNGLSD